MATTGIQKGDQSQLEEGYSKHSPIAGAQTSSRTGQDGEGLYNIQPAQTLTTTTKLTHLGTQIDIVKTTSGHYVSRKMIEQLRNQQQLKLNPPADPKLPTEQPVDDNSPYRQSYDSNSVKRVSKGDHDSNRESYQEPFKDNFDSIAYQDYKGSYHQTESYDKVKDHPKSRKGSGKRWTGSNGEDHQDDQADYYYEDGYHHHFHQSNEYNRETPSVSFQPKPNQGKASSKKSKKEKKNEAKEQKKNEYNSQRRDSGSQEYSGKGKYRDSQNYYPEDNYNNSQPDYYDYYEDQAKVDDALIQQKITADKKPAKQTKYKVKNQQPETLDVEVQDQDQQTGFVKRHPRGPTDSNSKPQTKLRLPGSSNKQANTDSKVINHPTSSADDKGKHQGQKIGKQDQSSVNTNFLSELSGVVTSIRKFEDSCKVLEQLYKKSGLDLRSQLNFDYIVFSRNILNIVRQLLNEVSLKDKSREPAIKTKIDYWKEKIAQNQGHIDFLLSLEKKPEVSSPPSFLPLSQPLPEQMQIGSLFPPQLAAFQAFMSMQSNNISNLIPSMPMFPSTQQLATITGDEAGTQVNNGELIKNFVASGNYGSYIMKPCMPLAPQTELPNTGHGPLTSGSNFSIPTILNPSTLDGQTNGQPSVEQNSHSLHPTFDANLAADTVINPDYTLSTPRLETPVEFNDQAVNMDEDYRQGLGFDSRLYSGFGGLFGGLQKPVSSVQKCESNNQGNQGGDHEQENLKSLFSLFTQPAKQSVPLRQIIDDPHEESGSKDELKLYSDEEDNADKQEGEFPKSLEKLLDEDSICFGENIAQIQDHLPDIGEQAELDQCNLENFQVSNSAKNGATGIDLPGDHQATETNNLDRQSGCQDGKRDQAGDNSPINLGDAAKIPSKEPHPLYIKKSNSNLINQEDSSNKPSAPSLTCPPQAENLQSAKGARPDSHKSTLVSTQPLVESQTKPGHNDAVNFTSVSHPVNRTTANIPLPMVDGKTTERIVESKLIEPRVGQLHGGHSFVNPDHAVPMTDNFAYQLTRPSGFENHQDMPNKEGPNRADNKRVPTAPGPNQGLIEARRDLIKESPVRSMLTQTQTDRLIDIGRRASKSIFNQAGKVLDAFSSDSKYKRGDKRTEQSYFTEKENPEYLTIFELCTSSEHSGVVQRKLSKLKEQERIELFYLMKPYLLRLTLDGLGKYVIHALVSMSRLR